MKRFPMATLDLAWVIPGRRCCKLFAGNRLQCCSKLIPNQQTHVDAQPSTMLMSAGLDWGLRVPSENGPCKWGLSSIFFNGSEFHVQTCLFGSSFYFRSCCALKFQWIPCFNASTISVMPFPSGTCHSVSTRWSSGFGKGKLKSPRPAHRNWVGTASTCVWSQGFCLRERLADNWGDIDVKGSSNFLTMAGDVVKMTGTGMHVHTGRPKVFGRSGFDRPLDGARYHHFGDKNDAWSWLAVHLGYMSFSLSFRFGIIIMCSDASTCMSHLQMCFCFQLVFGLRRFEKAFWKSWDFIYSPNTL